MIEDIKQYAESAYEGLKAWYSQDSFDPSRRTFLKKAAQSAVIVAGLSLVGTVMGGELDDLSKARSYNLSGKPTKSLKLLRPYENSTNPEIHNEIGGVFTKLGKLDEAINAFQNAIKLNPKYALAHNNLAITYGKKGNRIKELLFYQKALKINPKLASAQRNVAHLMIRNRRFNEAHKHVIKYLQLKPNDNQVKIWKSRLEQLIHKSD
ncbi:MAG: tetratricopeptide repeat protein [Nanoarchaeota archaeon]|nr:tetratricopeptide repeat protein [Nanoarchaeota archaeon]